MLTEGDLAGIGGRDGLVAVIKATRDVIEHLLRPVPTASVADRETELRDRNALFTNLVRLLDLVPSEIEIAGHLPVIIKTLDVMRVQYPNATPAQRASILLAWQGLFAAATAAGARLPAEFVPPIVPNLGATALPSQPVAPAPGPLVPVPGGGGDQGTFGQGMALAPIAVASKAIEGMINQIVKRTVNTEDEVIMKAVGELANDLVEDNGRTEKSAKNIGALLRFLVLNGQNAYVAFDRLASSFTNPDAAARQQIASSPTLSPALVPLVAMFYMRLAHIIINMFVRSLTQSDLPKIRDQILGRMSSASTDRALALGFNAPKEGKESQTYPAQDVRFNWVQNVVNVVRAARRRTAAFLVDENDPAIAQSIAEAALVNSSRW